MLRNLSLWIKQETSGEVFVGYRKIIMKMLKKEEKREEKRCGGLEEHAWEEIVVEDLQKALGKYQKWESPGTDKVRNFWLNPFNSIHTNITNCFNRTIKKPRNES